MFRSEEKAMPLSTASKLKTSGRKNFQMEQEIWEEKLATIEKPIFLHGGNRQDCIIARKKIH